MSLDVTEDELLDALEENNQDMVGIRFDGDTGRYTYDSDQARADKMALKRGRDLIYPGVRNDIAGLLGIDADEEFHQLFNQVVNGSQ